MSQTNDNIENMRAEYAKLHDLLKNYPELHQAFMYDPLVHKWLKAAETGHATTEEALVHIITDLAERRRVRIDMLQGRTAAELIEQEPDKRKKYIAVDDLAPLFGGLLAEERKNLYMEGWADAVADLTAGLQRIASQR